ncbi:MAG: hypothetical protein QOI83_2877, partial [Streptomycetaceae bacterium]|nr:hypothetical protein [Streptomycetaceae bacterium]
HSKTAVKKLCVLDIMQLRLLRTVRVCSVTAPGGAS